jgi:hypothetical protein
MQKRGSELQMPFILAFSTLSKMRLFVFYNKIRNTMGGVGIVKAK